VGRRRSRPPRTRRSATHPLGKPAPGADFTAPEEWTLVGSISALVNEDVFDQVQKKLALNRKQASRNNKSHSYLLRALVSCGACQSACISRTTNGGRSYYACRCLAQPLYSGHDKRCRSRYIPADQLDTIVWQDLSALLREPESIVNALQRAHNGHWLPQELQARRETLQKTQATLRQQVERLTEAYLAGVLPLPEYQRRRQELDTRNASLEQQARELTAHVDRQQEISHMAASIEDFCQRIQTGLTKASFAQKRTLVELLIDRVLVTNDEVEIRYVVPTHARSETTRFCHLRKGSSALLVKQDRLRCFTAWTSVRF
jgi:site-specific DNA recombinase